MRSAVAAVVDRYGALDILVNDAGIGAQGTVEDNADAQWQQVFDVNVFGMVRVSRAALPHLRVTPGTADTPWIDRLLSVAPDPAAERAALAARRPHGRLVRADEVAAAIAYLASPAAGSTAGVDLAVDGGMAGLRLRPANQP